MKAVIFSGTKGDPGTSCSYTTTAHKPKPGKDQVLVRMLYSPCHPSTLASVSPGPYPAPEAGTPPGMEGVGTIEEHGEGCATAPPKGTRVLVLGVGTLCEYVVIPGANLVTVPDSVSNQNAAQFYVNPMSAYLMTTQILNPAKGEYILQTAAGSILARTVIQLSKVFGFKTINVIRNEESAAELKAAGADEVIVTSKEKVSERVAQITGGKGVKYVMDCVGGELTSEILLKAVAYKGKCIFFGQLSNDDVHFKLGEIPLKMITIQPFWLVDWALSAPPEEQKKSFKELMDLFASGKLDCPRGKEFELKDYAEAFKASADSKAGGGGKVLIKCS